MANRAISLKFLGIAAASMLALGLGAAPAAAAAMFTVTARGNWNTNAPVTPYSQYPEAYSLSFELPEAFTTIFKTPQLSVTTEMTDVHYSLGGVDIPVTVWTGPQSACFDKGVGVLCNIAFLNTPLAGGMALAFSDHVVEFYGLDFGSDGTLEPARAPLIPNIDDTLVNEGTAFVSVVPEPAAWSLLLTGAFAVGGFARATRRRPAAA